MKWASFILIGVYIVLGTVILFTAPFGSFPDEKSHYAYVEYLRTHQELPRMIESGISVAFHPPLYYLFCALLGDPLKCRIFSLLLGGAALLFLFKTASLVFPKNPEAVLLSTALAALNPQFIFIHSGISNIAMASLTCALTTFFLIRIVALDDTRRSQTLMLGASLGLAMLSRSVSIYLIPPIFAGLFYRLRQKNGTTFLKHVSLVAIPVLVISVWWYAWSWMEFGDPFQFQIGKKQAGGSYTPAEPLSFQHLIQTCAFLHASFWAYFGRMEFHAGIAEYTIYLILEVLGLIGIFQILRGKTKQVWMEKIPFLLLLFSGVLAITQVVLFNMKIASPQGRYLYMAIIPISTGLSAGILQLLEPKYRKQTTYFLTFTLFIMCLYQLTRYWFLIAPH